MILVRSIALLENYNKTVNPQNDVRGIDSYY